MNSKDYFSLYKTCDIECVCGGTYKRMNKTIHKSTRIHKLWVMYNGGPLSKEEYDNRKLLLSYRYYADDNEIHDKYKKKQIKLKTDHETNNSK